MSSDYLLHVGPTAVLSRLFKYKFVVIAKLQKSLFTSLQAGGKSKKNFFFLESERQKKKKKK